MLGANPFRDLNIPIYRIMLLCALDCASLNPNPKSYGKTNQNPMMKIIGNGSKEFSYPCSIFKVVGEPEIRLTYKFDVITYPHTF